MDSVLTVSCKLVVQPEQRPKLEETLCVFAQACQHINDQAPAKLTNRMKLQALVYQDTRERFGLSANLTIQAVRRVAANRKTALQKGRPVKGFAPTSASYDQRIFSFREQDWTVSLTLLGGRERFPLLIGDYQRSLLTGSLPTSATLTKRKDGTYYLQIQVKSAPPTPSDPDGYLGADLGRRAIVVTSDAVHYSSEAINKIRDHYAKLRAALQRKAAKGTRSSRRRCRQLQHRLSGKERRFQGAVNHCISKDLVHSAKATQRALVLEDLTGIRERTNGQRRNKTERRRANSWAFYQLRHFIAYKALNAGVPLILVNPAYTSQTCHRCLHIGHRSEKSFRCSHCGWSGDADLNGSIVIALLGAAVDQLARGPGLFCSLHDSPRATKSPCL
jgi:putative transposase